MLTRIVLSRTSARAALALMAALPVFSQPLGSSGPIDFGMLGLAQGQTMRLSVVAASPGPCLAQIGFLK